MFNLFKKSKEFDWASPLQKEEINELFDTIRERQIRRTLFLDTTFIKRSNDYLRVILRNLGIIIK